LWHNFTLTNDVNNLICYSAKDHFYEFLKDNLISLIKNPETALFGVACFGVEREHNGKNGVHS